MFTDEGFMVRLDAVLNGIDFQPTVDAVEVVHGEWIHGIGSWSTKNCSECNWKVPYFSSYEDREATKILYKSLHYCPNCGAKMDLTSGGVNEG